MTENYSTKPGSHFTNGERIIIDPHMSSEKANNGLSRNFTPWPQEFSIRNERPSMSLYVYYMYMHDSFALDFI